MVWSGDLDFIKKRSGNNKNTNAPLSNHHRKTGKRGKKKIKYQDQNIAVKKDAVNELRELRKSLMMKDDTHFAMVQEMMID